ncbi:MAG TPA: energy transducer TonB [Bacteroidales bacterium]|nr:energy transducer TonB [Bacteroidales bacterium]
MNRNREHKTLDSNDYFRYKNGKMTGKERNVFERELQKDPFAEDASDGFSMISSEEAEKDLSALRKKIVRRTGKRSYAFYYRIAAAVAVLVTISVIFLNRNPEQEIMLSKNDFHKPETTLDIAASEPIIDKSDKIGLAGEMKKTPKPEAPPSAISPSPTAPELQESVISAEMKDEEERQADKEITAALEDDNSLAEIRESERKMERSRVAGVSAPIAAKSISLTGHTLPQPITGIDSFNIYIEKNIRQIRNNNKTELVVIISFVVNPDSSLTNIKILESPGQAYSREAKRLLKEGPSWIPATENGQPVEEEHSVNIIFR